MNAKTLNKEMKKSLRFLPSNLDEVKVLISNNTFYFIKDEQILHKFTVED